MLVQLIAHTNDPEKTVAAAAKLCYSDAHIETLLDGLTPEKTAAFLQRLNDVGHCYDEETEVLTDHGFIKWPKVNKKTNIAIVDPVSCNFNGFETPKNLYAYNYDGDMVKINSKRVDLFVTDGHKLYASTCETQYKRTHPEYHLMSTDEVLKTGKKLKDSPFRLKVSANNPNVTSTEFDRLFELYGFFIGDGYASPDVCNSPVSFHLKLTRKISYLRNLCKELGLDLTVGKNNKFFVYKHEAVTAKIFREMFYDGNKEKTFPDSFYLMSKKQFFYFIRGLINSDGHYAKLNKNIEYSTTSYEIATKVKYHARTGYSSLNRRLRIVLAFAIGVAISIPIWSYTLMYLWNWFIANDIIGTITPFRAYCIYFAIQFFVFGNIFNVHHINSDRFEIVKQTIKNKATKFDNVSLSDSTCVFLYTLYIELKTPLLALLFGYIQCLEVFFPNIFLVRFLQQLFLFQWKQRNLKEVNMTEILTSHGFEIVMKVLGINAKRTYSFISTESSYWIDDFEIWEVPESFIDKSDNISEEEWCSLFPDQWFRGSHGTVLEYSGLEVREFTINGAKLNCWVNPEKLQDFIFDDSDEEREYSYSNILQYCSEEWSVGQPRNICAICVGLAKINNLSYITIHVKIQVYDTSLKKS